MPPWILFLLLVSLTWHWPKCWLVAEVPVKWQRSKSLDPMHLKPTCFLMPDLYLKVSQPLTRKALQIDWCTSVPWSWKKFLPWGPCWSKDQVWDLICCQLELRRPRIQEDLCDQTTWVEMCMPVASPMLHVSCDCEGPWGRAECPEFACVSNETRAKWRCERKRLGSRGAGGSEWRLEPDPPYLVNSISPWFTRVHHSFGSWLMRFSCHLRLQVPGGGCASVDSLLGGDLRCSVILNSDVHYVTLCIATFSFRCVLRAAAVSILRQRIEDASASRLHIGSAVSKICFILSFPPPWEPHLAVLLCSLQ